MPTTKEASSNGTNLNVLNRHWSEHHRQLTADARQWVQQAATAAVHADSTDPWTTAAVMAALDMRHDAPMSYSRQTPQHRYTMVRYALANAASEGHLGAQPTVNSRGRDSVGYVAPAAADPLPWRVEVTGGPRAANVVKQLEAWLKANAAVVGDLDGLLILRK